MKVEFSLIQKTHTGSHVKVFIDEKEAGILYLSDEEVDGFLDLIRKGITGSKTEFINSLNLDDGEDDLEDID